MAGQDAAAVAELGKEGAEGKAPRVDGARCALRMLRGERHHLGSLCLCPADARCNKRKVPGSSEGEQQPLRGAKHHHKLEFGLMPRRPCLEIACAMKRKDPKLRDAAANVRRAYSLELGGVASGRHCCRWRKHMVASSGNENRFGLRVAHERVGLTFPQ
jgi:hypothetical protein